MHIARYWVYTENTVCLWWQQPHDGDGEAQHAVASVEGEAQVQHEQPQKTQDQQKEARMMTRPDPARARTPVFCT